MKRQYSLAAIFVVISLAAIVLAIVAFAMQPAKFYTADQIHVSKLGVHIEGIDIEFSTFGETSYACPGVSVERNGDLIDVYFHRNRINQNGVECEIPCVVESDGKYSINIPIEFTTGKLRLNGTKILYSKGK